MVLLTLLLALKLVTGDLLLLLVCPSPFIMADNMSECGLEMGSDGVQATCRLFDCTVDALDARRAGILLDLG